MAFSFGSSAPSPAALGGSTPATGFSFAGAASATTPPAPSAAPLFGSTTAAQPSAFGGFGSTTTAPPTPAFGTTPAPAFWAAPAPAFGASAAPGFGSSAPAPGASLFGTPATAPPVGAPAQPALQITGQTPYSALPPEAKRAIDAIYEHLMRHKRTMAMVETMSPALLRDLRSSPADVAAGDATSSPQHKTPLPIQLGSFQSQLQSLQHALGQARTQALELTRQFETSTTQSIQYGMWPVEAVAMRRGVKLSKVSRAGVPNSVDKTAQDQVKEQIRKSLDQQVAHVDRLETIPSPYMWQVLRDLLRRLETLQREVSSLQVDLGAVTRSMHSPQEEIDVATIVQAQADAITRMTYAFSSLHAHMESLRTQYSRSVAARGGIDALQIARVEEAKRMQKLELNAKAQVMKATPTTTTAVAAPGASSAFGATPAPSSGGLFGSAAPAPAAGGLFGAKTPAPAPGGGLFGNAPAPAPAGGSLFGASAPAPTGGGLFGSTTASAPGTTTPAPATGGGLFGGTAPAAPAPAGHGTFGATPGAATTAPGGGQGTFSFGGTSNTSSTPKTRSKNRARR